jgi:predicted dehydrogenase
MNRKDFVKATALAGAAMVMPAKTLFAHTAEPKVRIALLGTGLRGQNHLELLLRRNDVEVVAICDIDERMLSMAKNLIAKAGKNNPRIYTGDPAAWKKMLAKEKLDAVLIATPWELHKPMIIGAVHAGIKYVATEVMLGITLEDHWEVVKAAEQYNAHVMMLENVCYRRDVMAIVNMVG